MRAASQPPAPRSDPTRRGRSRRRGPAGLLHELGRLPDPEAVLHRATRLLRDRAGHRDPVGRSVELVLQAVHQESGRMARWLERLAAATAPTPPAPARRPGPRPSPGRRRTTAPDPASPPPRRRAAGSGAVAPRRPRRTVRVPVD